MSGLWFLEALSPAFRFTPLHFVYAASDSHRIRFRSKGLCALQPPKWKTALVI